MEESRCRREKGGDPVGEIHAGPPVAVTCSPLDYQLRQPFLPLLLFYNYCIAFFFSENLPAAATRTTEQVDEFLGFGFLDL